MDRRKSLMETNGRQKFFHRHPTIIDTQPKSSHTIRHAGRSMPKIKLTTNDKSSDFRSISSPRLKNFPAEEMRRVVKSPRPNVFPFPAVLGAPTPFANNPNGCQGDGIPQPLLSQPILQNHNQTMSQPFLTHPISNQAQHSEIILHSNSIQRPPDRQTHRPFVPNTVRNSNPRQHINLDNQTFETPINYNSVEDTELHHETNIQSQTGPRYSKKIDDLSECEKQPVGGRCAELHRLAQLSEIKPSTKTNSPMPETRISNQPHQSPEFYHKYRQQMQPSAFYHDIYHNPQPNLGRIPTVGMTSPQNLKVNRVKSHPNYFHQHPTNQRRLAQAIVKPPAATWPQTMFPNISRPQSCQHVKNIPRNNSRPNNSPSTQQQQQEVQGYPPQTSENYPKIIKKKLQFTPAMIRDQELLVTTMRQQEIPEDIMKRQFDALLNEQTRQLIYEQQLEQSQEDDEVFDNVDTRQRRKVSKIDDDGKPEWMVHITPPWIPYASIEKMENNMSNDGKKYVTINENLNQQQEQQQQYPEYNYYVNEQQGEIPYQNAYQQYQQSMDDRGHHHENFYNQPNYNSVPYVQQHTANTYPMSILKTRNDNSPIMKQSHRSNNGLQDSETVKRALEELKNAQNRKGFEYLMNVNKKHVQLNGIQNPDDPLVHNLAYQLMPEDMKQDVRRGPSANGLENKRNPNNPPPPPTLHLKDCSETVSEYPRQRVNRNIDNSHVIPAGKENFAMMNSIINGYQNNFSAFQNSTVGGNARYKNSIQAQVSYQDKGEIAGHYNYGIHNNLMRSNSLPPNMYSEYQPVRINDYNGVPDDIYNDYMMAMRRNEVFNEQYVQPNVQMQTNIHVPEQYLEARIIGGVKYLARRTECNPHYGTNETTIGNNISSQPIAFY